MEAKEVWMDVQGRTFDRSISRRLCRTTSGSQRVRGAFVFGFEAPEEGLDADQYPA